MGKRYGFSVLAALTMSGLMMASPAAPRFEPMPLVAGIDLFAAERTSMRLSRRAARRARGRGRGRAARRRAA